jgi:hypothetical protein
MAEKESKDTEDSSVFISDADFAFVLQLPLHSSRHTDHIKSSPQIRKIRTNETPYPFDWFAFNSSSLVLVVIRLFQ